MFSRLNAHKYLVFGVLVAGFALIPLRSASALSVPSNFSLQITPSPIVLSVNPGQASQIQLKIQNNGSGTENLEINPRSFSINNHTGQVVLGSSAPTDVASWLNFSAQKFSVAVGQVYTEQINMAVPKDAGFSYYFVLVISRQANPTITSGGRLIKASLADFVLMNVNRPGATRKLAVTSFTASRHIYSYLPADFNVEFRNIGNTIVQPFGNIFVERGTSAKTPLATLAVNPDGGYILPGTNRIFGASWNSGFPYYKATVTATGTSEHLTWDWSKLSNFRLGKYHANLVAVYNNGTTDVPIQGSVGFLVLPWLIILVFLVVLILLLFGIFTILRRVFHLFGGTKRHSRR